MTKADLEKLSTRQLLSMMREYWASCLNMEWDIDDMKAVLATREHIPNKKEGEVLRRKRQKTSKESRNQNFKREKYG